MLNSKLNILSNTYFSNCDLINKYNLKSLHNTPRLKRVVIDFNLSDFLMSSDFSFPKEWAEFCIETRPELSPVQTFDKFKDYWIAQAGQKGVKLDWFATWRNWVRNTNAPKQNPADIAGDLEIILLI